MLKKTFSRSRLSPDTLDKVKMGVMLPGRSILHDQNTGITGKSLSLHIVKDSKQKRYITRTLVTERTAVLL